MDRNEIENVLSELSGIYGVSGFEDNIAKRIRCLFEPYTDSVTTDALGSVSAYKGCGKKNAKKIMIDAHMDEVGLMVTDIDEKGFLKFTSMGGIDERILPACEVVVHGKTEVPGIIGIKPPHLQGADESKKTLGIDKLAIDIGMNKEKAKQLIEVGDTVSYAPGISRLLNGQVSGKSFDDRAGICALIYAAEKLSHEKLNADVYFVASTREETNLAGAKCAAYTINPDCALVIDVTHGKTPDNTDCAFDVGRGVAYSLGPNVHTPLAKLIKSLAEKKGIDAREEVDGGSTGTNAWSVQISRGGVATAVISIPLKYMHTPTEVASLGDIEDAGELVYEFVKSLSDDSSILNTVEIG